MTDWVPSHGRLIAARRLRRSVLKTRGETLTKRQKTLSTGLDKLNMTKAEVAVLKQQLAERQPILEATTKQAPSSRGDHRPHARRLHDLAFLRWRRPPSSFGR